MTEKIMSEELYGQAGNEAAAGYEPLPEPSKEEAKTYSGEADGIREAASDLTDARQEDTTPIIERDYRWIGGELDGQKIDQTKTAGSLNRASAAALCKRSILVANQSSLRRLTKRASPPVARLIDARRCGTR